MAKLKSLDWDSGAPKTGALSSQLWWATIGGSTLDQKLTILSDADAKRRYQRSLDYGLGSRKVQSILSDKFRCQVWADPYFNPWWVEKEASESFSNEHLCITDRRKTDTKSNTGLAQIKPYNQN